MTKRMMVDRLKVKLAGQTEGCGRLNLVTLLFAAGIALALYLYYGARVIGNNGFPLDDSWIHLQIARNLATGQGWSYNPGEPTGASTTPLWVLLITPLFWLPGDVTAWVRALGSLLFLADVLLVADIARRVTGDRRGAWLAGLLTAWGPTAVWGALSGMEVHLYLLLVLLGLRAALVAGAGGRSGHAATAWLALAGWARPEVWALLPVAWGYLWRRGTAAPKPPSGIEPLGGLAPSPAKGDTRLSRPRPPLRSLSAQTEVADAGRLSNGSCDFNLRAGVLRADIHAARGTTADENVAQDGILRYASAILRAGLSFWAPHLLIAAVIMAAFFAFNLLTWGRPLPGTWYAKTAFGQGSDPISLVGWLLHFGSQFMSSSQAAVYSQNPLLAVTLALGAVALWQAGPMQRRGLALLLGVTTAACVAAAAADLGSVGLQHYRRAAHMVACLNVLAAAGAVALWDVVQAAGLHRDEGDPQAASLRHITAWLLAAAVLAMQLAGLRQGAIIYANDTRSINNGDVAAARWIAANAPADTLVAVNDIGALAYFGGRRVVDLVGLASPEVVEVLTTSSPWSPERERRLRDLLLAQGVDYVAIFPEWFPILAQDPALVEVTRFTVPRATALAHDNVVIYRLITVAQ